jgi:hypothetical protein
MSIRVVPRKNPSLIGMDFFLYFILNRGSIIILKDCNIKLSWVSYCKF